MRGGNRGALFMQVLWVAVIAMSFLAVVVSAAPVFYAVINLPAGDDFPELIVILTAGLCFTVVSIAVLLLSWNKVLSLCDARRSH